MPTAIFTPGGIFGSYVFLDGTGDYISTPDAAPLDVTGDIDLRCAVAMDDWTPAATQVLISKRNASDNKSYQFQIETTGRPRFFWSPDGTTDLNALATVAPTVTNGALLLVRVTFDVNNGASGRDAKFYTKASTPLNAAADLNSNTGWTQLGTTVTSAGVTSIFSGAAQLVVGAASHTGAPVAGKVYAAQVRNGIDGTVVADPDLTNLPTFPYTDATGREWSLNGDARVANPSDGWVNSGGHAAYATAREDSDGLDIHLGDAGAYLQVGQRLTGGLYNCYQGMLAFDTSSLPDDAVINSVELSFHVTDKQVASGDFDLEVRLFDWGVAIDTTDLEAGSTLGAKTLLASRSTTAMSIGSRFGCTSDAAFKNNISLTATTKVMLHSSKQRLDVAPTGLEYLRLSSWEASADDRPKLTVVYNEAVGSGSALLIGRL